MDTSGLFDCTLFSELGDWLVTPTFYGDDLYASGKDAPVGPVDDGVADTEIVNAQAWDELHTNVDLLEGQVLAAETAIVDAGDLPEVPTLPDSYDGDIFGLFSLSALEAAPMPEDNLASFGFVHEDGSSSGCCIDDDGSIADGSSCGASTVDAAGVDDAGSCSIADGSSCGASTVDAAGVDDAGSCSISSYESECDSPGFGKVARTKRASRGRARPYDSLPKEKKEKKKLQNKNAATRYRQKKKAEDIGMLTEEQSLLLRNKELKDRLAGLQQEIDLLKDLMRDICCSSA